MIRYTVALLALVGMVAISGCGNTPKSVCESGVKASSCGELKGDELKKAIDKCVEVYKDTKTEELDKQAKEITCIEKSKYCEYKKAKDAANMKKVEEDCTK